MKDIQSALHQLEKEIDRLIEERDDLQKEYNDLVMKLEPSNDRVYELETRLEMDV